MQWNRLQVADPSEPMFHGLGDGPWFYFVHSLHGVPDDPSVVVGTVDYGGPINAAFRLGNVFAVQFHPEKSATAGLALLGNFVASLRQPAAVG
jgi:glutamine amidotransferase